MRIEDIKINGITNPVGFALDTIKVSWKVRDSISQRASDVRIEVSEAEDFAELVYECSGAELCSIGQKLDFEAKPQTRYYCRVSVTGNAGDSASDTAFFERGKGAQSWIAKFIGTAEENTFHPVFEKEFKTGRPVAQARLYVTGLGLYEAYINGEKAGDELLTPFCNDYREQIQYQTIDVTALLQRENRIAIYCGNGWYKGRLGYEGGVQAYGSRFAAMAELHIWYEDGSHAVIATDKTWKYRGSDIEMSDIYDGEILNRQLWDGRENPEKPVELIEKDTGSLMGDILLSTERLTERYSLPVIVKERLAVQEVIHTPSGEIVLDMGQNFTGFMEFEADFPAGTRIVLDFGEVLQQGNFYNDNYRTAKAQYVYVSDGRKETVRPHFTYYGFRYVRVSGWPDAVRPEAFQGCVVYSDLEITADFDSSSQLLNRLAKNCMWGQKSNFLDMPTDCPQRDERLAWTGDAQVFAPTACCNMDVRAFYRKFLRDLRTEQKRLGGAIANFIPNLQGTFGGASVWGDVATFLPMVLYRHYGDRDALAEYYPMMKDWADWIIRQEEENGGHGLWDFGFHFGDWLAQDGISPQSMKGGTDDYFIASVYYYASAKKVAQAAEILGNTAEAEYYRGKAEKIRAAVLDEYFSVNGRLAIDTQTAYLICLNFGLYREKDKVIDGLKERLRKDCYKIKGGFVGATMLCQVLAENGLEDVASHILFQEGFPGWMRCVKLGATTIWERWNSILDDGSISGTDMNSLNHYAYGAVMEYVYRYMAGIREAEPGFSRVHFAPQLNNKLSFVNYKYDSVSGAYASSWKINEDGTVTVRLEIPFGCSATAELPSVSEEETQLQGVLELDAGIHEFTYRTKRDYRKAYTMDSRLEEFQNDTRAMEILKRKLPLAVEKINSQDVENLNLSLNELQYMFFLGFNPPMVQTAAEELLRLEVIL